MFGDGGAAAVYVYLYSGVEILALAANLQLVYSVLVND